MDTSEQYIMMCDCEEVQKGHKYNDGDWYYYENDCVGVYTYHMITPIKDQIEKGLGVAGRIWWLPRQDQLQAMLHESSIVANEFLRLEFLYKGGYRCPSWAEGYTTMEQVWLAFCMAEKYGKIWTGEEWR